MKIPAILLALVFWAAPLIGAVSVECTCGFGEGGGFIVGSGPLL